MRNAKDNVNENNDNVDNDQIDGNECWHSMNDMVSVPSRQRWIAATQSGRSAARFVRSWRNTCVVCVAFSIYVFESSNAQSTLKYIIRARTRSHSTVLIAND